MSRIKKYLAYLKGNPERYWFKRKLYGWGWTPATWQGWVAVGVYIALVIVITSRLDEAMSTPVVLREFIVPLMTITALLVYISYVTGESPRWQWGERDED